MEIIYIYVIFITYVFIAFTAIYFHYVIFTRYFRMLSNIFHTNVQNFQLYEETMLKNTGNMAKTMQYYDIQKNCGKFIRDRNIFPKILLQ